MQEFPRQLGIWTLICGASAAPSFCLALIGYQQPQHIVGMLLGIACFIVAYAGIACTEVVRRLRRSPRFRRTMRIGYGTRIGLSLLGACVFIGVPWTAIPDMYLGIWSIEFVENLGFREETAMTVFLTTIVQGMLLNLVLAVYMGIVHLILIPFVRSTPVDGACPNCGYDLRASRDVCPECGTAIVATTPP